MIRSLDVFYTASVLLLLSGLLVSAQKTLIDYFLPMHSSYFSYGYLSIGGALKEGSDNRYEVDYGFKLPCADTNFGGTFDF